MSIRDGYAIQHAIKNGYRIAIITGGKSEGVVSRLKNLGVENIFYGISEKVDAYEELVFTYNINPLEIINMGDDLPEIEVMHKVGVQACPKDAAQ